MKKRAKVICIALTAVVLVTVLAVALFLVLRRERGFGIYLVTGLRADHPAHRRSPPRQAWEFPPEDLILAEKPVISDKDIIEYDWKTHTIKLVPGAEKRLPKPSTSDTAFVVSERAFVVVANGRRCYLGYFCHPPASMVPGMPVKVAGKSLKSFWPWPTMPGVPAIYLGLADAGVLPKDSIRIDWMPAKGKKLGAWLPSCDPRPHPRIKECLKRLGKLRE